jgi:hypothetical protein
LFIKFIIILYLAAIEDPKALASRGKTSALMLQASGPNPMEKKKM